MNREWRWLRVAVALVSIVGAASLLSCGTSEANYYFPQSCRLPRWFKDIARPSVDVEVAAYINKRGRELVFDVYSQKRERIAQKTASVRGDRPVSLGEGDSRESFEVISADGVTDVIRVVYDNPHGVSICTVDDPEIWQRLGVSK